MPFSPEQVTQLLQPINPARVLRDGKGNAHVAQQDVTAHLTRIFGFGGWNKKLIDVHLVYETERLDNDGKPNKRWDVCYNATMRLEVKDRDGNLIAFFEDGSSGVAENQKRGDAHDLARKSAISLSTKRAAKDLGDQFGLSLYNKGQLTALVKGTLVGGPDAVEGDVQEGVEQQVSMGNDEIDTEPAPAEPEPAAKPAPKAKAATPEELQKSAVDNLIALCDLNAWDRGAVNNLYIETYKAPVKDGTAEDLFAFHALLKTGAIKLP